MLNEADRLPSAPGLPTDSTENHVELDSPSGGSAVRPISSARGENEATVISQSRNSPTPSAPRAPRSTDEIGRDLVGQTLGGFRLDAFVGGGGMGAVFAGTDLELNRTVAVKVLTQCCDDATVRRFRMEAQSAARLNHDNIARVFTVGESDGWNFIVFEYVEGENLRDIVIRHGPLSIARAVSIMGQITEAIHHAASQSVVHRDIKPSNILLTAEGRAKLVDMGLARLRQIDSDSADLTASGVTLGTFDYISPEQGHDPREVDVRSDLYSLGCTMYYVLTGRPPFAAGTPLQKLLKHAGELPPDPRDFRADLPRELSLILWKLLAKDPDQRFQRPAELLQELARTADLLGLPTMITLPAAAPRRSPARARRARHLPWLVPSLTLGCIWCVLQVCWWLFQPAPPLLPSARLPQRSLTPASPFSRSEGETRSASEAESSPRPVQLPPLIGW